MPIFYHQNLFTVGKVVHKMVNNQKKKNKRKVNTIFATLSQSSLYWKLDPRESGQQVVYNIYFQEGNPCFTYLGHFPNYSTFTEIVDLISESFNYLFNQTLQKFCKGFLFKIVQFVNQKTSNFNYSCYRDTES